MSFWSKLLKGPPPRPQSRPGEPPPTLKEKFSALKNLPRMFRWIWEISPAMTIATLLLRFFQAAVPLLTLYVGKLIIDEIVLHVQGKSTSELSYLWGLIALEFAIVIGSDILSRGIALIDSLLGDLFTNHTSVRLMKHAAELDLDHFEDAEFYDKMERARRSTTGRIRLLAQVLGQVQDMITIGFLSVGLIAFNPWLILLLIVTLIPAFFGETHFNSMNYSLMFRWTPERRQLDYLRYTGASDTHAKEVKIFGLASYLSERYRELSDQFYAENRSLAVRRAAWGTILAGISSTGYYAAYVYIAYKTVSGDLSVGDLTFLSGSFMRLRNYMQGILTRFSGLAQEAMYLQDMFDFFDLKPQIASPQNPRPLPKPIREGFRFENVGFKYLNSDIWALRNVSFTLAAGEKLALVGENGAGKTTLVKLLSRLYDPTEGRILLDGIDLKEYDVNELRNEVGVIFQDFIRYYFSARDNIAVGEIQARDEKPLIETAAEQSLAAGVIQGLPEKYDQMLGKRFDGGVELSGGQWQKVALARAYFRDAQLLILDEPTAALDARAEHDVFQRFTELTEGKSAVLISHRFSTVRMADRIVVLEDGTILESGSHQELLEKDGRYAELFNLQAAGYR